ncbi:MULTISPECIES: hypothetical protein [Rhizobium]|uniref:Nmad2 family putative nucleotide modification protein n=1 Tax=Rhizobium TaxID=379 RepID=UPI0019316298|nr:hypothetical protein [Rhizobium rosettiformans]
MKIYRYVIDHDMGFSPNPFHGVCTLANCKPVIRRVAQVGDFVLGFGSAASSISERLIYWMRVEEILSFDQYWLDHRFEKKKPVMNGSFIKYFGDNIYHSDSDGQVLQDWSFHSLPNGDVNKTNLKTDTGSTNKILVSSTFGYYGVRAVTIPGEFASIIPHGRGHRTKIQGCSVSEFVDWLLSEAEQGFVGEPSGWQGL